MATSDRGPRLDPNNDPDADHDPTVEEENELLDPIAGGGAETVLDDRAPDLDDISVGAPSGQQTSDRATGITALP